MLLDDVGDVQCDGVERLGEEVRERRAEGPRAGLGAEVEEVRQDGAGYLLVVVADRPVGVRQVSGDTLEVEGRSGGDGSSCGLAGSEAGGNLETRVLLLLGPLLGLLHAGLLRGLSAGVDRDAKAVALDRHGLCAQHPVLEQPVLVRAAQEGLADPVTALTIVDVGDQAGDLDPYAAGVRELLDPGQSTVLVDLHRGDRPWRAPGELGKVRQPVVSADVVHLLEEGVSEHELGQGQAQVLSPGETAASAGWRCRRATDDGQAQVGCDQVDDLRSDARGVDGPSG